MDKAKATEMDAATVDMRTSTNMDGASDSEMGEEPGKDTQVVFLNGLSKEHQRWN